MWSFDLSLEPEFDSTTFTFFAQESLEILPQELNVLPHSPNNC